MNDLKQFLKWFGNIGGPVPTVFDKILAKFTPIPIPVSSFKNRAADIKKKYNYRFKNRSIFDDFMSEEPDLDKLYFERRDGSTTEKS